MLSCHMLMMLLYMIEDVVATTGWIGTTGVSYASTCVGSIGVVIKWVEMLLHVLVWPLQMLEIVG